MAKKNGQNGKAKTPKTQASAGANEKAGNGGTIPPVEHRWKPGQSGNPKGTAGPGRSIQAAMRKLMNEDYQGKDLAVAMAKIAVQRALRGDYKFFEIVMERIDGKVVQELNAEIRSVSKAYPADVLEDVLNAGRNRRTTTKK